MDYLTELQRRAEDLAAQSENWMPWNDRENLPAAGVFEDLVEQPLRVRCADATSA